MNLPDYALVRIAREAGVSLASCRNHFAGRVVEGWVRRRIEAADKKLGKLEMKERGKIELRDKPTMDLEALAAARRKRPKESDVEHMPGYERRYWSDEECAAKGKEPGFYEYRVPFVPNEAGKKTHAMVEVEEMMRPSIEADVNRIGGTT